MANMGLGVLAGPNLVFKRKFRWTLDINTNCGYHIPQQLVKVAGRPNISIEETEIHFLNGKMYIPGKATWETITVTFYDVGHYQQGVGGLYSWLTAVYNFTNPVTLQQSSSIQGYSATGVLNLYDGCGTVMETWTLSNMFPQTINFGDLDYSSSEEVTIEVTLRYSQVQYTPGCGNQFTPCPCTGC